MRDLRKQLWVELDFENFGLRQMRGKSFVGLI